MGTQTAIASQIFNAKADYVLALKANHPNQGQTFRDSAELLREDRQR
jgi:hypothetical protein